MGVKPGSGKKRRKREETGKGGRQNTSLGRSKLSRKSGCKEYYRSTRELMQLLRRNVQLSPKAGDHKYVAEPSWLCDVIFLLQWLTAGV